MSTTTARAPRATATPAQVAEAAEIFASEPATRTVAFWQGDRGDTYVWGHATVDNRRSRVLARIAWYGDDCLPDTLVLVNRPRG